MEFEGIMLVKDRYCVISLVCGILKKQNKKQTKQKQTHRENRLVLAKGRRIGKMDEEDGGTNF